MPYIKQEERPQVAVHGPANAGQLNYAITKLIMDYLEQRKFNYQALNDVGGALYLCGLEFNRRLVSPYEDRKIEENGDVY